MLQDVYETCRELLIGATMPKALACHGSVVLPRFSCPCYRVALSVLQASFEDGINRLKFAPWRLKLDIA